MILAQFQHLKFEISARSALLFQNLKISSECETEDKTDSSQQYVSAKNGKPVQVTFTAVLNAALGEDVEKDVTYMLDAAQRSMQGYLYIAGKKAFPFKMMMVKAETEDIIFSPSGKWARTNVNVTLKQSTKDWITGNSAAPAQPAVPSGGGGYVTPAKASANTSSWETYALIVGAAVGIGSVFVQSKTPTSGTSSASTAQSTASKAASAISAAAKVTSTAKSVPSAVSTAKSAVAQAVSLSDKFVSAVKK